VWLETETIPTAYAVLVINNHTIKFHYGALPVQIMAKDVCLGHSEAHVVSALRRGAWRDVR